MLTRNTRPTRIFIFISVILSLIFIRQSIAEQPEPLVFGLLPSESASSKFQRYASLRTYLSEKLGRDVILETAKDFKTFTHRTKNRRYDFLETAPHFILPAVESGKYQVITTISKPLTAQVVVRNDSSIKSISDMDSIVIATPSAKAIITKIGKEAIKKVLGEKEQTLTYIEYRTHNAAFQAAVGKNADAALISVNIYKKALKNNIAIHSIGESVPIPNMSILVAADLKQKFARKLQKTLVDMNHSESGQAILKNMSYPGYRRTSVKEFEILKKYQK